jgi:hypothetical protein
VGVVRIAESPFECPIMSASPSMIAASVASSGTSIRRTLSHSKSAANAISIFSSVSNEKGGGNRAKIKYLNFSSIVWSFDN